MDDKIKLNQYYKTWQQHKSNLGATYRLCYVLVCIYVMRYNYVHKYSIHHVFTHVCTFKTK